MLKKNPSQESFSRREFMRAAAITAVTMVISGCVASASTPPAESAAEKSGAEEAKEKIPATEEQIPTLPSDAPKWKASLLELAVGNLRFVMGKLKSPHQSVQRREELVGGQYPFAAVLSCSDSRLPPEIIFDQGLGDLFVVRVAGNVAAFSDTIASLEYAVEHLHAPLIVVLGHQKCGAITAALEGTKMEGSLGALMESLQPAVEAAKSQEGDKLENAIRANVHLTVKRLHQESVILAKAVEEGEIDILGAYYSLETGKVELI